MVRRPGAITVLDQFTGSNLGRGPNSLVMGPQGVLYGTTRNGLGGNRPLDVTFFSFTPGKGLKTVYRKLGHAVKATSLKVPLKGGAHPSRIKVRVGFVPKKHNEGRSKSFVTLRFP